MKRDITTGRYVKRETGEVFENFGVWHDHKGYAIICVDGKDIKLHVFVWERAHGPKPKGYVIHHKDMNKGNYSLDNLILVHESWHRRLHAGWTWDDNGFGKWVAKPCNRCGKVLPLSDFYERRGYTPCALCKPCHNIVISERRANLNLEAYRQYKHSYYLRKTEGKVKTRRSVMPHA